MDEAQKMQALKKVYAEMILNTGKEAAARVMASEQRALRFQQDLRRAKDEGLRTVVRLKQMFDFKITEAEITVASQRGRIGELEAQLNEAEEIIVNLRLELKLVEGKLEKVKKNQVNPSSRTIATEDELSGAHEHVVEPITLSCSDSGDEILTTSNLSTSVNQKDQYNHCHDAIERTVPSCNSHVENHSAYNTDLASSTVKTEEIHESGCAHQICAFEGGMLEGKLPLGDVNDQHKEINLIIKTDERGVGTLAPSSNTKNCDIMTEPLVMEEKIKRPAEFVRRITRRTQFGSLRASSCKSYPSQLGNSFQPFSALPHCNKSSDSVDDDIISGGVGSVPSPKANDNSITTKFTRLGEKSQFSANCQGDQASRITRKGLKRKNLIHFVSFTIPNRSPDQLVKCCQPYSLSDSKSRACSVDDNSKPCGDFLGRSDLEVKKSSLHLDSAGNAPQVAENVGNQDRELMGESVFVNQGSGTVRSSMVQNYKGDQEVVTLPSMVAEPIDEKASEEKNGAPSQAYNNRFLSYTFQRKRKKESSMNSNGKTSFEESISKRRLGEKENVVPGPQKFSLINESAGGSQRLVQVAHQLTLLSGRRWW